MIESQKNKFVEILEVGLCCLAVWYKVLGRAQISILVEIGAIKSSEIAKHLKVHNSEASKFLLYLVVQWPRMLLIEFGKIWACRFRYTGFGVGILLKKDDGDDVV